MPDNVVSPKHYLIHAVSLEPVEITGRLPSMIGQAINYVLRSRFKGSQLEDLKKARFYLELQYDMDDMFRSGQYLYDPENDWNSRRAELVKYWVEAYITQVQLPVAEGMCIDDFEKRFLRKLFGFDHRISYVTIKEAKEYLDKIIAQLEKVDQ